ncbi:hypothetical protein PoB_005049700 [Plakobranchus ocellatus]|uniref:Uncharacterized protein n=1 Tax=Plakobranchus ocellatus TaxID=259542 RepID=A0AAV4BXX9_9GAST|nr:hypothetical protein PoB_005049700 [Plakobranchus ocellatus]
MDVIERRKQLLPSVTFTLDGVTRTKPVLLGAPRKAPPHGSPGAWVSAYPYVSPRHHSVIYESEREGADSAQHHEGKADDKEEFEDCLSSPGGEIDDLLSSPGGDIEDNLSSLGADVIESPLIPRIQGERVVRCSENNTEISSENISNPFCFTATRHDVVADSSYSSLELYESPTNSGIRPERPDTLITIDTYSDRAVSTALGVFTDSGTCFSGSLERERDSVEKTTDCDNVEETGDFDNIEESRECDNVEETGECDSSEAEETREVYEVYAVVNYCSDEECENPRHRYCQMYHTSLSRDSGPESDASFASPSQNRGSHRLEAASTYSAEPQMIYVDNSNANSNPNPRGAHSTANSELPTDLYRNTSIPDSASLGDDTGGMQRVNPFPDPAYHRKQQGSGQTRSSSSASGDYIHVSQTLDNRQCSSSQKLTDGANATTLVDDQCDVDRTRFGDSPPTSSYVHPASLSDDQSRKGFKTQRDQRTADAESTGARLESRLVSNAIFNTSHHNRGDPPLSISTTTLASHTGYRGSDQDLGYTITQTSDKNAGVDTVHRKTVRKSLFSSKRHTSSGKPGHGSDHTSKFSRFAKTLSSAFKYGYGNSHKPRSKESGDVCVDDNDVNQPEGANSEPLFSFRRKNTLILRTQLTVRVHAIIGFVTHGCKSLLVISSTAVMRSAKTCREVGVAGVKLLGPRTLGGELYSMGRFAGVAHVMQIKEQLA